MTCLIFSSYAREDKQFAEKLIDTLTNLGMTVWMDVYELKAGEKFPEEIENAILSHDKFIFIASKYSTSPDCFWLDEIKSAKKIIKSSFQLK